MNPGFLNRKPGFKSSVRSTSIDNLSPAQSIVQGPFGERCVIFAVPSIFQTNHKPFDFFIDIPSLKSLNLQ